MSVHALSVILGNGGDVGRSNADGYARLILIAVAHRADDRGFAWPSTADLAKQANVHRGTVNRRLDDLIRLGELRMFTRGHYRSPAFVMTMVDHPLTSGEIYTRLRELDSETVWEERVPGQGSLPLQTSSQTATISPEHGVEPTLTDRQAADQDFHRPGKREKGQSEHSPEIVADSDDPSRSATGEGDIVADSDEIVAVARRSSEPSGNPKKRARSSEEKALFNLAVEEGVRKGMVNPEGYAYSILYPKAGQPDLGDRQRLTDELTRRRTLDTNLAARSQCPDCDELGRAWYDASGNPVGPDDPDGVTSVICTHPEILEAAG